MMKQKKRAQAAAAAALIAIITILIILYLLFIPPAERAKILGEGDGTTSGTAAGEENVSLLLATPGRIDFISQKTIEHAIPTTHIFTKTEGLVLEKKLSIYTKKSLFSSMQANMSFEVSDLANTENVALSGLVKEGKGRLVITLNGQEIFNNEVVGNLPVIELAKKDLKASNELTFAVSSPSISFWKTNEYTLEEVKVTADVTSTGAQSSKNTFLISATEKNNLERAYLKFAPDCTKDSSPLDVWINQYNIYSGAPDCGGGRITLEFSPNYLNIDENEVVFRMSKGDYYLSHMVVSTELKTIDFPVYYFELSEEQYQTIKNDTAKIVINMNFVDVLENKRGDLVINGHINGFDTDEIFWEKDISDDAVRGNNGIQIRPRKTLDIRELEVILVPK